MGLFGISEVLLNLERTVKSEIFSGKVKGLFPTLKDWGRSKWAIYEELLWGSFSVFCRAVEEQ